MRGMTLPTQRDKEQTNHSCFVCLEVIPIGASCTPCDCAVCGECVEKYLIMKIEQTINFSIDQPIQCPNHKCEQRHFYDNWRKVYPSTLIDEKLLKRILQVDPSVRACPLESCPYFGFLPETDQTAVSSCIFTCEACQNTWVNCNVKNTSRGPKFIELLSEAKKIFATKACPRCTTRIEKNRGCSHMQCSFCSFSFCWHCSLQFEGHSQRRCKAIIIGKILIWVSLAILIFFASGFIRPVVSFLKKVLQFGCLLVFQNFFFAMVGLAALFFRETQRLEWDATANTAVGSAASRKFKQNRDLAFLTGGLAAIYLALLVKLGEFNLLGILNYAMVEASLAYFVYYAYQGVSFIWRNWMVFVY